MFNRIECFAEIQNTPWDLLFLSKQDIMSLINWKTADDVDFPWQTPFYRDDNVLFLR